MWTTQHNTTTTIAVVKRKEKKERKTRRGRRRRCIIFHYTLLLRLIQIERKRKRLNHWREALLWCFVVHSVWICEIEYSNGFATTIGSSLSLSSSFTFRFLIALLIAFLLLVSYWIVELMCACVCGNLENDAKIGCALIGSLGASYNGLSLINLAIALFALVAIESSSQSLGRTYAFLLFCAILLDISWFILFANEIWCVLLFLSFLSFFTWYNSFFLYI